MRLQVEHGLASLLLQIGQCALTGVFVFVSRVISSCPGWWIKRKRQMIKRQTPLLQIFSLPCSNGFADVCVSLSLLSDVPVKSDVPKAGRKQCMKGRIHFGWHACRKAFRLGKFLQDVNALRHSRTTGLLALLELVAYGGEGVYYFIEQLAW